MSEIYAENLTLQRRYEQLGYVGLGSRKVRATRGSIGILLHDHKLSDAVRGEKLQELFEIARGDGTEHVIYDYVVDGWMAAERARYDAMRRGGL